MNNSIQCPVLAIVACGGCLEVACRTEASVCTSVVRLAGGGARRSSLVVAAIDLVVKDAGIDRSDLGTILVTRGPGSFTGIRAGLATAMGLEVATKADLLAFSSLQVQAARVDTTGSVWAAQPGRRGEVYGQEFEISNGDVPNPVTPIRVFSVAETSSGGPWVAPQSLQLAESAKRAAVSLSTAEALIELAFLGAVSDVLEPLYVEGPPIHSGGK
ncbi:MAG: tRNA (adenosine(37)-N6)-threonylcarbamoyltransferase complex dimerization subunit type 1 TsaB [bacterium]|nr:tRNA (adenosine(37)-N6)-threonylcarbamoyltransferase complex dimerization subunit type 1 TsaB [bacterium]